MTAIEPFPISNPVLVLSVSADMVFIAAATTRQTTTMTVPTIANAIAAQNHPERRLPAPYGTAAYGLAA
jgi:energy-coupling factor transporter transmembrane protein EcfT